MFCIPRPVYGDLSSRHISNILFRAHRLRRTPVFARRRTAVDLIPTIKPLRIPTVFDNRRPRR